MNPPRAATRDRFVPFGRRINALRIARFIESARVIVPLFIADATSKRHARVPRAKDERARIKRVAMRRGNYANAR
jgi:hypothetical protein